MAEITRRTWDELRDEALSRAARGSGSASRMEEKMTSVYLELALTYHHFELDETVSGQVVSSGAISTPLPADVYVVTGVRLLDDAGAHLSRLSPETYQHLHGRAGSTAERPERYSRWGNDLHFASLTDADYEVDIAYYRVPTAPDFAAAAAAPETHWLWDEAILRASAGGVLVDLWASDVAAPHLETLNAFLERVASIPLAAGSVRDVRDGSTVDRPHGGPGG